MARRERKWGCFVPRCESCLTLSVLAVGWMYETGDGTLHTLRLHGGLELHETRLFGCFER
jgi:hypothetical protein